MSMSSFSQIANNVSLPTVSQVANGTGSALYSAASAIARANFAGLKALASIPFFAVGGALEVIFMKGTTSYTFLNGQIIPTLTPNGAPTIGTPVVEFAKSLCNSSPLYAIGGVAALVTTIFVAVVAFNKICDKLNGH